MRKEKKMCDVHTSPIVAADAAGPDGSTLVTDGDATLRTLRAQIINIAHVICLIINHIIIALRAWEQTGISVLYKLSAGCEILQQTQGKCRNVTFSAWNQGFFRRQSASVLLNSKTYKLLFFFFASIVHLSPWLIIASVQLFCVEVACTESPNQ